MTTMTTMTTMTPKYRPLYRTAEQVRAILAGATQFRVPVKPQPFPAPDHGDGVWMQRDRRDRYGTVQYAMNMVRTESFKGGNPKPLSVTERTIPVPEWLVSDRLAYSPGDRFWVREKWAPIGLSRPAGYWSDPHWIGRECWYAADNDKPTWGGPWRSALSMTRALSRLTLEVVVVGAEPSPAGAWEWVPTYRIVPQLEAAR